jgi:hypothetical protein
MEAHTFEVLVRAEGEDHFTAHAIGFPDVKAEAATEKEAVRKVRESLVEILATTKIVKVSIPGENPWLKAFGHAKDDPDFEAYLEEIQKARLAAEE